MGELVLRKRRRAVRSLEGLTCFTDEGAFAEAMAMSGEYIVATLSG